MIGYRLALAGMLLLSGACGLVFQTTWLREFRLIFGGSTPAAAAVLAVFMGGLGIGNALFGGIAQRSKNPLRLYALLEGGIAIGAMLTPMALKLAMSIYIQLGGQSSLGPPGATAVRLLLAALVMGLPTILMGGTLPAVAKAVTTESDTQRRWLAVFYGFNTMGAVMGTMLSAFFMLEWLGQTATLYAACAVNLLLSVIAWMISSRPAPVEFESKRSKRKKKELLSEENPEASESIAVPGWSIYLTAALCGCMFFLMELVWDRMLSPLLGGSTFTFAVILATVLLGIGIGGLLYPLVVRTFGVSPSLLAFTCAVQALAIAVPFALGDRLAITAAYLRSGEGITFIKLVGSWFAITGIVVFPAALIAGMQFPILAALLGRGEENVSRQYGYLVFWNTVGSIAGALAGGFGLMPLLTALGAWRLAAVAMAGLAGAWALLGWRRGNESGSSWLSYPALGSAMIAVICLLALGPTAMWRHSGIGAGRFHLSNWGPNDIERVSRLYRGTTVWEADGVESAVAIREGLGPSLIVNGKSDGDSVSDVDTQVMLGLLAPLLRGSLGDAIVVGLGTGETAGWLAECPDTKRVDVVELEPAVAEMAHRCRKLNVDVLNHPKVKMIYNDAREVLLTSRNEYDLIVSEPSNPYRAGVASLFTTEYYAAAKKRLRPGGMFVQWLQGYEVDVLTVQTVFATLLEQFDHVEVWSGAPVDLLLVCRNDSEPYDWDAVQMRLERYPFKQGVQIAWNMHDVEGVAAHFQAGVKTVRDQADKAGGINTDDKNMLEYAFARSVAFKRTSEASTAFDPFSLRKKSLQDGDGHPPSKGKPLELDRIADRRMSANIRQRELGLVERPTPDREERRTAMLFAAKGDLANALKVWQAQKQDPDDAVQCIYISTAIGMKDPDKMKPFVEKLTQWSPLNGALLETLRLFLSKETELAEAKALATIAEFQDDPWYDEWLLEHVYAAVLHRALKDEKFCRKAFDVLGQPFPANMGNQRRLLMRRHLAVRLGPTVAADEFAAQEPFIEWEEGHLKARAKVYRDAQHPLATEAEAELDRFRANAS